MLLVDRIRLVDGKGRLLISIILGLLKGIVAAQKLLHVPVHGVTVSHVHVQLASAGQQTPQDIQFLVHLC